MEWYEACEWSEQDTTRTLEHIDDLLELWTAGIASSSIETDVAISEPVAHVRQIAAAWRESDDQSGLAAELWARMTAIDSARDDSVRSHVGSVVQINSSAGGVPKSAVDRAVVGWRGVEGDVQQTRRHHGRPWQALCLLSADVINRLSEDGHPIVPGGTGENLTLRGVDWSALRAGTVLDVGNVRCQLTAPAVPCSKIAASFTDRQISLVDHDVNPGNSRWYAAVLRPGEIATGDVVSVSPTS